MIKNKYLFIVPKKTFLMIYEKAYLKVKDMLDYEAIFAVANNCIVDTSLSVYHFEEGEIEKLSKVYLNGQELDEKFRIFSSLNCDLYKKMEDKLIDIFKNNVFDAIINACDNDEEGLLQFDYVVDTFKLKNEKIINLNVNDLSEKSIINKLKEVQKLIK